MNKERDIERLPEAKFNESYVMFGLESGGHGFWVFWCRYYIQIGFGHGARWGNFQMS